MSVTPVHARAGSQSRHGAVLVSAVTTQLMIVLDMTVIAIALPRMQADLQMSADQRPWVVTAYTLAFGGLVLFGGRLCAVLGIRRAYPIGLVGFAAASLVAGLAPSFSVLIAARAVQGGFAALLAPTNLALVNVTFVEPAARTRAFAMLGATGGLGAAVGLLLGGAITDSLGWRWTLFVNVAIAACALLVGRRSLPPVSRRDADARIGDDILGLLLGCGAVFALVYGLDRAQTHSWTSMTTMRWLACAAVLMLGFVLRERIAQRPVLPLWIVTDRARAAAYATQFLVGAAQMGAIVYLTFYFQNHLGYSPMRTGVHFLPMVAALVATAAVAGRLLVPRLGALVMLPLGLTAQAAAFALLARLTVDSSYAEVALPGLLVFGVGVGLTMPVAFNVGTRGVPAEQAGLASAVLSAAQQIGSSFGVALLAGIASHSAQSYLSDHAGELRNEVVRQLLAQRLEPHSARGLELARQLTDQLTDRAAIHAYAGGFEVLAWVLAGAAAVLIVASLSTRLLRRRQ